MSKHTISFKDYINAFGDRMFVRRLMFKTLGNFLILISLFFTFKTFYEPLVAEATYFIESKIIQKQYVVADSSPSLNQPRNPLPTPKTPPVSQFARFFNIAQVESITPVNTEFAIVIPKIAANSPILPNINPGNEREYLSALQQGVAHAAGTNFPGSGGHVFLFAHSTDYVWNVDAYNAVFYLLYKLEPGDEIYLYYQGRRYVYVMESNTVVDPDRVEYLTRETNDEFLTLQTCWPPGTTLKRLLVFARLKAN